MCTRMRSEEKEQHANTTHASRKKKIKPVAMHTAMANKSTYVDMHTYRYSEQKQHAGHARNGVGWRGPLNRGEKPNAAHIYMPHSVARTLF